MLRTIDELPRLLDVLRSSDGDTRALQAAVMTAFDIPEWEAAVMLSVPVSRLTPHAAAQLRDELADVCDQLEQLSDQR